MELYFAMQPPYIVLIRDTSLPYAYGFNVEDWIEEQEGIVDQLYAQGIYKFR